MVVYKYSLCVVLFMLCMLTPLMECSQRDRCGLNNLSCEEAMQQYKGHSCDDEDPDDVQDAIDSPTLSSKLEVVLTGLKCKVFRSKIKICNLSDTIRGMVTTNCCNSRRGS